MSQTHTGSHHTKLTVSNQRNTEREAGEEENGFPNSDKLGTTHNQPNQTPRVPKRGTVGAVPIRSSRFHPIQAKTFLKLEKKGYA